MTRSEKLRLLSSKVGYMELPVRAGAFSCGTCRFATRPDAPVTRCHNPSINAPVSTVHGCCNLFYPVGMMPTPHPDWVAARI